MVEKGKNWIEYVDKSTYKEDTDYMDISVLESLEELKKHYQFEAKKGETEDDNITNNVVEVDEKDQLKEAEERRRFENSSYV